ncbi:DUF4440 domain-containing protein [Acidimangrovimonas pyrenivorans]|uniref:DUF4440 domain-containing protein n=1 Tax=Acidimangrovimonas pyrenivorans TaxID=2030798 RepID=A0ABV7AFH7_9RHOB
MADLETFLALERRVWEALVAGDPAADGAMLEDGFLGVYSDGFAAKADHAGQLAGGPTVARYELGDARLLELAPGVVLLAYRAEFVRVGSQELEAMYVSSVWRRAEDGGPVVWRNVFSQDTAEGGPVPV